MTPPKTEYRTIPLTRGRVAVVDAADYDQLSQHKWFCSPDKGSGVRYAVRKKGPYQVFMHRELLGLERFNPLRGDHINGDGLDNRRANLRAVNFAANCQNQRMQKNNTSGYRGVSFAKLTGKWHARIWANRKLYHLGFFTTKEQARDAYARAARELHGEYARKDIQ